MAGNSELDLIAQEARAAEAEQVAADAPAAQEPQVDPVTEWSDAVDMGCELVFVGLPELEAKWTADRRARLAAALAKCAERYGWTVDGILGHPLLHLAVAVWPMAASLIQVARAKAIEKRREAEAAAAAASAARAEAVAQ